MNQVTRRPSKFERITDKERFLRVVTDKFTVAQVIGEEPMPQELWDLIGEIGLDNYERLATAFRRAAERQG